MRIFKAVLTGDVRSSGLKQQTTKNSLITLNIAHYELGTSSVYVLPFSARASTVLTGTHTVFKPNTSVCRVSSAAQLSQEPRKTRANTPWRTSTTDGYLLATVQRLQQIKRTSLYAHPSEASCVWPYLFLSWGLHRDQDVKTRNDIKAQEFKKQPAHASSWTHSSDHKHKQGF